MHLSPVFAIKKGIPRTTHDDDDDDGRFSQGTPAVIPVPAMGDSITEGTIVKWHKKAGDQVEMDEILCEVETDKVRWWPSQYDSITITIYMYACAAAVWHEVEHVCVACESASVYMFRVICGVHTRHAYMY